MFASKKGSLVEPMVAGALTGGTQTLIFYPLDVIRARQQVDFGGKLMRDVWKGVMFSTVLTMMKRGATVVVYDVVDRRMKEWIPQRRKSQALCSGTLAGIFEALLIQPFNVLRLRVQTDPALRTYRSALRQLVKTEKLTALYNGFFFTTAGNIVWWVTCPALYRRFQSALTAHYTIEAEAKPDPAVAVHPPEHYGGGVRLPPHEDAPPPAPTPRPHSSLTKYQLNLACGLGSSFITTLISLPLTRLASLTYQMGKVTSSSALQRCLREGKLSFFKGWAPTFIRMTVSGALMMPLMDTFQPVARWVADHVEKDEAV